MNKQNATHGKVGHSAKGVHTSSATGTNSHTDPAAVSEKPATQGTKHKNTKNAGKESMLSKILDFPRKLWHRFS
jgi:hypothetical protein